MTNPGYIYKFIPSPSEDAHTILLLHGTGGNEDDLLILAGEFGSSFGYLSLRGNVPENGMPRFFARLAMGIFDEDDLRLRTGQMCSFVASLGSKESFNPDKIIAVGYSNGANIAGAALMQQPGFLKGAVLFRPMQPFKKDIPEFSAEEKFPVLMTSGSMDPTVTVSEAQNYARLLETNGYDVTHEIVNTGHNLTSDDVMLAKKFLSTYF